jgi:TonB-linked SusC/RagA family outer membrane protein
MQDSFLSRARPDSGSHPPRSNRSAVKNFAVRFIGAVAVLVCAASALSAQAGTTISGTVTSDAGVPLPSVNVLLPAFNYGTQTDDAGRYSFTVPASRANGQTASLVARVIGYTAKTVSVTLSPGQNISQDFVLVVNPLRLGDVLVTGAGTTSTRERLGSVINSVDSSLIRRSNNPQNVVSALAATAPNVEVRTQSGDPGASASIKIRGNASLTGTNQPMFVVDGQPIDNQTISTNGGDQSTVTQNRAADINPNDIESVEILKGAAAASIYGASAANGVILITTKRGRSGPTRYTLSSSSAWDQVQDVIPLQQKYGQGTSSTVPAVCGGPNCNLASVSWGPLIPAGTPVYNHEKEIFDTGTTLDNNLSMSGGNDRTSFYLSGGLTAQNGTVVGPNNKYNRASFRLKGTHQLTSTLSVGGNFNYIDTRGNFVQKGSNTSGLLLGALRTTPAFNNQEYLDPVFGLHRSYRFPNPTPTSINSSRGYDNPFFTLNNPGNKSELVRQIANINAEWTPFGWLTVKETLGGDYYNDHRLEALPFTSSTAPSGRVLRYDLNNLEIDNNLIATAVRPINENIDLTVSVGQNLNSRRFRSTFIEGDNLKAPTPFSLQNTLSTTPTELNSLAHIEGYFGQAEVGLYNQLYLMGRLRNDGYSTFGASKRRNNFPAFTAAWTFTNFLHNEDHKGILSFGKLRFAYGETGKEPPVYSSITALSTGVNAFGSGFGDFINATQGGQAALITSFLIGNNSLRPERSRENEYGADFGFFDQRADLGLTWYNKRSTDVIIAVPVSAAQTGATQQYANAASLTNKGVEISLNVRPYTTRNVAWEAGVTFGRNNGVVNSLAGAQFIPYNLEGFTGAIGSSTVGYAPGVIRGLDFARCGRNLHFDIDNDNVVDDIDALCAVGGAFKPGALLLDQFGQPIVDPTDRVIANPNPKYTMGYNTSLKLMGKLTLSGLLDVRKGGQVWDGTRSALLNFGTHAETLIRDQQGQFGKNFLTEIYPDVAGEFRNVVAFTTPNDWAAWFRGEGGSFGQTSAQFIEDGSFVKLREISIAYTLDQPFIRRLMGFSTIDVRLAGRNLHTWTKYRGLDPEANLGGAEFLTQGLDFFNNPQTRSFVLSLNLNR